MKSLLVIAVVLTVFFSGTNAVLNNNIKLLVRPRLNQCAKDLGVSQTDLNAVINNDLSNTSTPLQCLALCFFQATGTMDAQGNVKVVVSKLLFSTGEFPCKVNRIVNKCSKVKGANPCNTAYLVNKCYVDEGLL